MTRTLLLPLLFAAWALAACTPGPAAPLVNVTVIDRDGGQVLPVYVDRHHPRGDRWVPGIPGQRYAVRLTNTTGARVLVVLSVDGVNAVSGEDADPSQAGYVLGPWQSTEVAGWRKSMDDIAQFYFTDVPDSYAARTGRPDNIGVIGVAVFEERLAVRAPPPVSGGWDDRDRAQAPRAAGQSAPAGPSEAMAQDGAAAQRIGTGHGGREWSPVMQTAFVRAGREPVQLTQLRYDAPGRLAALGILAMPSAPRWARRSAPRAFPPGFAPDPPPRD